MDSHRHHQDEGFNFDEQQAGFVMGALVGALVGGAAALLLSPKNGKEMRQVVKKYSKELEQEAQELAKDARGTANSFRSVLQEGATEVMEQAPEKIEQAGYQAQQLADELSQRFESARDVVTELAEAFRSGWEEYGEDQPEDELKAAPSLLGEDEEVEEVKSEPTPTPKPVLTNFDELDDDDEQEEPETHPVAPLQARRRTHTGSAYSMHSTPTIEEDQPVAKATPASHRPTKDEDPAPPKQLTAPSYTTRVLDEPKKVETAKSRTKTEDASAKKSTANKKKLLFRRSAK